MQLEANIIPFQEQPDVEAMTFRELKEALYLVKVLADIWQNTPLSQGIDAKLVNVVFIGPGGEESDPVAEYEFVVTRRYTLDGELHIGGANGEVLNATATLTPLIAFLERAVADYKQD